MSNEKIIQVITKGDQVLGLTESGHLAVFDDNLNAFKLRGQSEVYDQNHQVCTVSPVVSARKMALDSIQPKELPAIERKASIVEIAAGIAIIATMIGSIIYYLLKN